MGEKFYQFSYGRNSGTSYYPPLEESAALTEKQRRFLIDQGDIEEKSAKERALRARLRNRLDRSITDFALLHTTMEGRDLESAFEDHLFDVVSKSDSRNIKTIHQIQFGTMGTGALGMMYRAFTRLAASNEELDIIDDITDEQMSYLIGKWTESALQNMYSVENEGVENIEVSIELSFEPSIEELLKREPDNISIPQYERLLQAGEITQDQFYQFVSVISGENPHTEEPDIPLDLDQ
jgi:hypothetical protein